MFSLLTLTESDVHDGFLDGVHDRRYFFSNTLFDFIDYSELRRRGGQPGQGQEQDEPGHGDWTMLPEERQIGRFL